MDTSIFKRVLFSSLLIIAVLASAIYASHFDGNRFLPDPREDMYEEMKEKIPPEVLEQILNNTTFNLSDLVEVEIEIEQELEEEHVKQLVRKIEIELKNKAGAEIEMEMLVKIEDGNVTVTRYMEIEVNGKEIEFMLDVDKNATEMIINRTIEMLVNATVVYDERNDTIYLVDPERNVSVELRKEHLAFMEQIALFLNQTAINALREKGLPPGLERIIQEKMQFNVTPVNETVVVIENKVPVRGRILFILPIEFEIELEYYYDVRTGQARLESRAPWYWILITNIEG